MSTVELFRYEAAQLRTPIIDGEPWFVLADVCAILELSNPTMAAKSLDGSDLSTTEVSSNGIQQQRRQMNIVSESGLYELVFQSRKPEAKKFRRWVTAEVLPAIRKTGSYTAAPALTGSELLAAAVLEAQSMIAAKDAQIAELEPKANYVDVFVTDSDLLSVRTIASTLGVQESWLRQELVARKWIYAEHSSRWSETKGQKVNVTRYSEYSGKKSYFQRVQNHDAPRFRGEVMHTLKATAAGANAIARIVPRWTGSVEGDAA